MKLACALVLVLLVTPPLSAAVAVFYGTRRMRPSGVPGDKSKQVQTITQVADAVKVTTDIDMGNGTTMSVSYTTTLDGAEVPVYGQRAEAAQR